MYLDIFQTVSISLYFFKCLQALTHTRTRTLACKIWYLQIQGGCGLNGMVPIPLDRSSDHLWNQYDVQLLNFAVIESLLDDSRNFTHDLYYVSGPTNVTINRHPKWLLIYVNKNRQLLGRNQIRLIIISLLSEIVTS